MMDGVLLPEEFLQVLRLSLQSSVHLLETLERPLPDPEHLRKIIAAILWHRKFVLTYYIVVGIVVGISCGHGLYKRAVWRYRKHREDGLKAASADSDTEPSSSSSTLRGTVTPPKKDDDFANGETTPLLARKEVHTHRGPSFLHRLRAFLLYQPRPVRALTSPSNVLPNNGTTLLVLLFLAVNLFYLFYRAPLSMAWVFIVADRAGLMFVVNLPVLYIFAAKTNQPIKLLTGWSYEGLNLFHRRLGEWMIVFAVIHMLGMLAVWFTILQPLGYSIIRYLTSPTVYLGISAILSYFVIYFTSIGWFRQLYYETFLGLHIFFQCAALVFLFFHYHTAKPYVVGTFAIWATDRLLWRISLSSRRLIATLEVAPDEHTILVHCEVDLQQKTLGIRSHLHHGWLPGQHVFLTVPSMGFKYRFQAHPFTIASPAPPRDSTVKSWPLQLVIRSLDGFSLDLLKYARRHQQCEVFLDGPHGGLEALEAAHQADRVCFVAGGSGIAVTYPLAWDVRVKQGKQADALVSLNTIYGNGVKSVPAVVYGDPPVDASRYTHFWVRQDNRHEEWISIFPKVSAVKQGTTANLDSAPGVKDDGHEEVTRLITQAFDTRANGPEGGRPDMKGEIWNWVTSVPTQRTSSSTTLGDETDFSMSASALKSTAGINRPKEKICIIVSGPDGLVRDVRNIAAELVRQGCDLNVWVEKFGW